MFVPGHKICADFAHNVTESSKYPKLQDDLRIATECMEEVQKLTSANSPKINNEQCEYLSDKLKLVQSASSFFQALCLLSDPSSEGMVRCADTLKLLAAKVIETKIFIQGY